MRLRTSRPGVSRAGRSAALRGGALAGAAVLTAVVAASAQAASHAGPAGGTGTAGAASITTAAGYLNDRMAFLASGTTTCAAGTQPRLSLAVTWLNGVDGGAGVAGYSQAYSVTYYPQTIRVVGGVLTVVPPRFAADHVPMEFSDRANFAATRADDIGFSISASSTPQITETLHSWGDSVVTFSAAGADDGVLYGNDASTAHTAIALVKHCDVIPG